MPRESQAGLPAARGVVTRRGSPGDAPLGTPGVTPTSSLAGFGVPVLGRKDATAHAMSVAPPSVDQVGLVGPAAACTAEACADPMFEKELFTWSVRLNGALTA